jgi:hypothetical protein
MSRNEADAVRSARPEGKDSANKIEIALRIRIWQQLYE